jgi:protocatechuate 3,4-dioxygenase beta subunit
MCGTATPAAFIRTCAIRSSTHAEKSFSVAIRSPTQPGIAYFDTIYPGWYEGRAVHIHFKIRADSASSRAREFTSQLYFDEAVTDRVHREPPYSHRGRRTTMNEGDFAYRRGGKQLIPTLNKDPQGYRASFDIGLQLE